MKETYPTGEDVGRPIEALSGATVGVDRAPVLVQAIGGWSLPRGPLPSGPAALAAAARAF